MNTLIPFIANILAGSNFGRGFSFRLFLVLFETVPVTELAFKVGVPNTAIAKFFTNIEHVLLILMILSY